jgi:hypothetical protein
MIRFETDPSRRARRLTHWLGTCALFSLLSLLGASAAHADTVSYTLDNVVLPPGDLITGTFVWTFNPADFEGGSGEFTSLEIPAPLSLWEPYVQLVTQIQANQIELTGNGNYHDVGLDITIVLLPPRCHCSHATFA